MLAAFTGILSACDGNINGAIICLMLAGVCDLFDGPIARDNGTRNRRKTIWNTDRFAESDLIGFGVLPGVPFIQDV